MYGPPTRTTWAWLRPSFASDMGYVNIQPRSTATFAQDYTHPEPAPCFRSGVHYCLAPWQARLEAEIAFETLLRRFSDFQLAVPQESHRWRRGIFLRAPDRLPLRIRTA